MILSLIKNYLIKNAYKSRRNKLSIAYFQLFSILNIEADHKDSRALQYIKEVRREVNLSTIHQDISKSSIVIFLSEILVNVLKEEEQQRHLYNFLKKAIESLDQSTQVSSFHLNFLVELTRHLGFYPNLESSNLEYFNLAEGNFQPKEVNAYCISGKTLTLFKYLLGTKFDVTKKLNSTHM